MSFYTNSNPHSGAGQVRFPSQPTTRSPCRRCIADLVKTRLQSILSWTAAPVETSSCLEGSRGERKMPFSWRDTHRCLGRLLRTVRRREDRKQKARVDILVLPHSSRDFKCDRKVLCGGIAEELRTIRLEAGFPSRTLLVERTAQSQPTNRLIALSRCADSRSLPCSP